MDSGRGLTAHGVSSRIHLAGVDAGDVPPFKRCRQAPEIGACSPVARAVADQAKVRARALAQEGARCTQMDLDRYRRIVAVCLLPRAGFSSEGLTIKDTGYDGTCQRF